VRVSDALGYAFDHRRYTLMALFTGLGFALYQLFSTGTIYYDPNPTILLPQTYPSVSVYRVVDVFGFNVPATEIDLSPQLTIFANPEVILLMITEGALVAANAAMAFLLFDNARFCQTEDGRQRGIVKSLTSVVPGLSMLGCCGGAFLTALFGLGAGVGTLGLSSGSPYSLVLVPVPAVIMYVNLLWMAPKMTPSVVRTLDARFGRA